MRTTCHVKIGFMSSRHCFAGMSGLLLVFVRSTLLIVFFSSALLAQTAPSPSELSQDFLKRLSAAAIERTQHTVRYDPGYVAMSYPGGDVPADAGVCSDEVIRSYRVL